MTKTKIFLYLLRTLIAMGLAGFSMMKIRDLLFIKFEIIIPTFIYQMILIIVVYAALWLSAGKMLLKFKEDIDKSKKQ